MGQLKEIPVRKNRSLPSWRKRKNVVIRSFLELIRFVTFRLDGKSSYRAERKNISKWFKNILDDEKSHFWHKDCHNIQELTLVMINAVRDQVKRENASEKAKSKWCASLNDVEGKLNEKFRKLQAEPRKGNVTYL